MKRSRGTARFAVALVALAAAIAAVPATPRVAAQAQAPGDRPNIVLITTDDQTVADL
ncbi:MAG: hypothetical protein H0X12_16020, partial [Nocardioides sp.]|nr:hypothetical protein [Nocardioides sp.]